MHRSGGFVADSGKARHSPNSFDSGINQTTPSLYQKIPLPEDGYLHHSL